MNLDATLSRSYRDSLVSRPHRHYETMARIEGPTLFLRPMAVEDAELIVAWRSDPATSALFLRPQPTLEQHRIWFAGDRNDRVDYVAEHRAENRSVGTVNFTDIDVADRTAKTGTLIGDRRDRGRGFGREIKALWMLYGFAELGLRSVDVIIRADNAAMIGLDSSLGYRPIGSELRVIEASKPAVEFVIMRLSTADLLAERSYSAYDMHGFLERIQSRWNESGQ